MKLTKKLLNEQGIFTSFDVARKAGNRIFIDYIPADGRLTAYWRYKRLIETGYYHKDFPVTCRENKEPKLKEAIQYVTGRHKINITEKDPFGAWHPEGTMEKLRKIIEDNR